MIHLPKHRRARTRGQSLAEFALVIPWFMLLLGGMTQLGFILWGQNTLNQVVRDTGRWAATGNCSAAAETQAVAKFNQLLTQAGGPWTSPQATVKYSSATCPVDNTGDVSVKVTGSVQAPVFFPVLPGNGVLTSVSEFRVEPRP